MRIFLNHIFLVLKKKLIVESLEGTQVMLGQSWDNISNRDKMTQQLD